MDEQSKAAPSKQPRETTNRGKKRRNPRFPGSRVWTEGERERHRHEREATIERAGLLTDRVLDDGDTEATRGDAVSSEASTGRDGDG